MLENIRILVGIDGSEKSKKALVESIALAKCHNGFVKAITVYKQHKETEAEQIIEEARNMFISEDIKHEVSPILGSNPSRALQSVAKNENFDLIVVGSRGLGTTASVLLGSVSRDIVTNANCNVLVIKK